MKKILITGISGLVGRNLAELLENNSYEVVGLSRNPDKMDNKNLKVFHWDINKQVISKEAFEGVSGIVHLTGENIGKGRWTKSKKQKIIDSRVKSTQLLFDTISKNNIEIDFFVSASAVGFYPNSSTKTPIYDESSENGNNFPAKVCEKWEAAIKKFKDINIRTVIVRTGIVIEKNEEIIKKTQLAAKFGIIPVLGSGKQGLPWINIYDLCEVYKYAIENTDSPLVINAVAPENIDYKDFALAYKTKYKKNNILINIPSIFVYLMFGEKGEILVKGNYVSSYLTTSNKMKFKYLTIIDSI